jgi:adenine-specific DNA-methyltransferase
LLAEDGVIFISIDDNEEENLKKVCNEIFGEKNFVANFVWKKKGGAGNTERILGNITEYIVCYSKYKQQGIFNYRNIEREYKFSDELGKYNMESIEKTNAGMYERKTMQFAIVDPKTNHEFYPSKGKRWTIGQETYTNFISQGKLFFDYKTHTVKRIKRPEDYEESENVFLNLLLEHGSLSTAKDEVKNLIATREAFETPKPLLLIMHLLKIASKKDSLVLDFFSGSATTAQAVMQLNVEDGGNRKFIMVQLPEVCMPESEAGKAGYKNICEIGRERIRQAGLKIKRAFNYNTPPPPPPLDIGFRVFKLDSSNMKDTYYTPENYTIVEINFDELADNIKADRTEEDLLFGAMLELGIPLSSVIQKMKINKHIIFNVMEGRLIACFDKVNIDVITEIAKKKPYYAVFRDNSFASDSDAINFEQIFNIYSPNTIRKIL